MAGAIDAGSFLCRRTASDFARPMSDPGSVVAAWACGSGAETTCEGDTGGRGGIGGRGGMSRSTDRFRRETSTLSYLRLAAASPMAPAMLSPEFERDMELPGRLPGRRR